MQQCSFLNPKLETANLPVKTERIGIVGSGPSVGTTHFSILTAGYLAGVRRRSTGVLEWNDSGTFQLLDKVWEKKMVTNREDRSFNILEIRFCRETGNSALLECARWQTEKIVIDFGCYRGEIQGELLKCDRRFLVCSVSDWQLATTTELLSGSGDFRRMGWEYFASFGSDETLHMAERALGVRIYRIPFIRDAFVITGELMTFFGRFLN